MPMPVGHSEPPRGGGAARIISPRSGAHPAPVPSRERAEGQVWGSRPVEERFGASGLETPRGAVRAGESQVNTLDVPANGEGGRVGSGRRDGSRCVYVKYKLFATPTCTSCLPTSPRGGLLIYGEGEASVTPANCWRPTGTRAQRCGGTGTHLRAAEGLEVRRRRRPRTCCGLRQGRAAPPPPALEGATSPLVRPWARPSSFPQRGKGKTTPPVFQPSTGLAAKGL